MRALNPQPGRGAVHWTCQRQPLLVSTPQRGAPKRAVGGGLPERLLAGEPTWGLRNSGKENGNDYRLFRV